MDPNTPTTPGGSVASTDSAMESKFPAVKPQRTQQPAAEQVSRLPRTKVRSRQTIGGHTTKRYRLEDEAQRTIAHLRQLVNQKDIPGAAGFSLMDGALVVEWDE
ncbi:MAG: hypothetical protein JOY80_11980 [Candidatus Dormibacteraeota bacterium]|nr:hypothetical protein [Candidatus Dormibacteraeota bacterium]